MDSVRAKFVVNSHDGMGENVGISMSPVTGGSPENDQFFQYTPGGALTLAVVKPEIAALLVIGKECYVDITPVMLT